MPAPKSPQLRKDKVVGVRLTPHEIAWLDHVRGSQPAGTWVGELVRAEKRRWDAQQQPPKDQ